MTNAKHNQLSIEDFRDAGASIAEKLNQLCKNADTSSVAKERAATARQEAFELASPLLDYLDIKATDPREWNKAANEFEEYTELRNTTLEALSKLQKKEVTYSNNGNPKFDPSISKHWSRIIVSYREGGQGGQTKADKAGREAARLRAARERLMAKHLEEIIRNQVEGNTPVVAALVKSAVTQFGGDSAPAPAPAPAPVAPKTSESDSKAPAATTGKVSIPSA